MRRVLSTEKIILGGFGLALVVLCMVAGVSVRVTVALLNDLQSVSDQTRILTKLAEANGNLSQLAATARLFGAQLSDENYREWQKEEAEFEQKINEIEVQVDDSETQRTRLADVRQQLADKVRVTSRDTPRETIEEKWGIDSRGISQMRRISDDLLAMGNEERQVLESWNTAATAEARRALWTIGLATSMAMVLVAAAATIILRDLGARRRAAVELERAREAAEAASVAKSVFLANMSHELRTPLTSIMGYADLLLEAGATGPRRQEYVQTLRRSSEHLLLLINDILDLSKIEAGRMTAEIVECRLVDILSDVDSLMRTRGTEKGLAFGIEYGSPIPECVRTDPTRFRQIVMNLVSNAIKFTDEGSVRVQVHYEPVSNGDRTGRLDVKVVDTGIGISEQQQLKLFQPFTQADVSTTRRFGGTGLGLSISRRLAQMLGGDLSVHSAVDAGSTFTLWLPMQAVGDAMLSPGDVRRRAEEIGETLLRERPQLGLRVLLAEDGPENRDVVTLHLRHAGCEVKSVEDGQQAYEAAMRAWRMGDPYDVILMDMQMPVLDGYTATSKLRAEGYRRPIIALTAHAMKEDRERCIRIGCDEYVSKPIELANLLEVLTRFSAGKEMGVTERLMGSPALRQLAQRFCDGLPQTMETLRSSITRGAWDEVATGAHRLSGAGGAYGFEEITRQAKTLERLAKESSPGLADAGVALEQLEKACREARDKLAQNSAGAEVA